MFATNDIIKGNYQIIREIGRGGTGVVYLGYHLNLRKYIVLKRLTVHLTDEAAFRREADILKDLHHTGIPQIYDFFILNGEVFTVMDYIEGQPLDEYMKNAGRLNEDLLVRWFRQLTDVLVYLQSGRRNVIHSDIKPGNIMITPQGDPVLIDFNISINQGAERIVGLSRKYASPEQAWLISELSAGRDPGYSLDGRTDIYSLGAVFFKLVSGLEPDSSYQLPRLETMPSLGYSSSFLALIDKCVAWDRKDRFRNASALSAAVSHLYRMDQRYRTSVKMRIGSGLVFAVIFAAGVFCTVHGVQEYLAQSMNQSLSAVAYYTEEGNYEAAAQTASDLLGRWEFRHLIQENVRQAELYHVMGDAEWLRAESESNETGYKEAAGDYLKAVKLLAESEDKSELLPGYCADLAMAYQRCGDLNGIQALIAYCQEEGISNADLDMMRAAVELESGNVDGARAILDGILRGDASGEQKAKSCVMISQSFDPGDKEKLDYLRKALEYSGDRKYMRICAAAEYERACRSDISEGDRRSYAGAAADHYKQLCGNSGTESDLINWGIASYMAGRPNDCITAMNRAQEISDRYTIKMGLALAYETKGDPDLARRYCNEAIQQFQEQSSSEGNEDWQKLQELRSRL